MDTTVRTFAVPPSFDTAALAADLGLTAVARPETTWTATWLDTATVSLARWGCVVQHRPESGFEVTLPEHPQIPTSPTTVTLPGRSPNPTVALHALTLALRSGAPLERVARARVVRLPVVLLDGEDVLAEVAEREVSLFKDRRLLARTRDLEVTIDPGRAELTARLVALLGSLGATEVQRPSLLRQALGLRVEGQPDVVAPTLDEDPTVGALVRASLSRAVVRYLLAEPYARLGQDPEGVHQARVATRQLRSDLRAFRELLDPEWANDLRESLRPLTAAYGGARDADVLTDRLDAATTRLGEADRAGARPLHERLVRQREAAHDRLRRQLGHDDHADLLARLADACRNPRVLAQYEDAPAATVVREVMRRPWKHLTADADALGADPPDEALHNVRLRAKRVRYAAESLTPAVGKQASRFAAAAADVQSVLGDHQDAVIAAAWLRQAAAEATTPGTAFVAGMLAARELDVAAASRAEWPATWSALNRKKRKAWLSAS